MSLSISIQQGISHAYSTLLYFSRLQRIHPHDVFHCVRHGQTSVSASPARAPIWYPATEAAYLDATMRRGTITVFQIGFRLRGVQP